MSDTALVQFPNVKDTAMRLTIRQLRRLVPAAVAASALVAVAPAAASTTLPSHASATASAAIAAHQPYDNGSGRKIG